MPKPESEFHLMSDDDSECSDMDSIEYELSDGHSDISDDSTTDKD